ncbi:MAG: protein-L-isoaspartate(D-aspartate) O-methyltransferase [Deltaproteobacteria bacterium]|nr:protein-L-isoaspartate(D-aspartate) O-methyltransferase [Deltaproteobacteria bacterium]
MPDDRAAQALRNRMVEDQLIARGIGDAAVLAAMRETPRHLFVEDQLLTRAYADQPLRISHGQTISQPYMVARTLELARLQPADRVLEVGAGSGYQTAVLSRLAAHVDGLEIIPELAESAAATLIRIGVRNATIHACDGTLGLPSRAPFDAIVVAAGGPQVPPPLLQQLADGGRLVVPLGPPDSQTLTLFRRDGDSFHETRHTLCRFVDLRGAYGRTR